MVTLTGKVAVVTGASRGIGKGIALALGAEGATVYVTGRTVTPGSYPLPGTVGETAAEVDRRGGKGVPVQVDYAPTVPHAVQALAREARSGDAIVTLGAGSVSHAAPLILEALATKPA